MTKKPCIQGSVICFLKKCWDGSFYLALPVIHLAWYCLGNLLFALGMAECRHGTGFRVLEQPMVEPLISLRFPRSGLDPKPNEISGSISTDFSGYQIRPLHPAVPGRGLLASKGSQERMLLSIAAIVDVTNLCSLTCSLQQQLSHFQTPVERR